LETSWQITPFSASFLVLFEGMLQVRHLDKYFNRDECRTWRIGPKSFPPIHEPMTANSVSLAIGTIAFATSSELIKNSASPRFTPPFPSPCHTFPLQGVTAA
jgi:hypothetical protein